MGPILTEDALAGPAFSGFRPARSGLINRASRKNIPPNIPAVYFHIRVRRTQAIMFAGNRSTANRPVIRIESIIRSSQMMHRWPNFTGTSVPMQQGTKLARKMIDVTGSTASMKRRRMLQVPTATSSAGTVTSTKEIIAPVQAVDSSAPVKPKRRKNGQNM